MRGVAIKHHKITQEIKLSNCPTAGISIAVNNRKGINAYNYEDNLNVKIIQD